MKKINIDLLEYPQIRLEMYQNVRLSPAMWNRISLDGHFWRFYHNSERGAGVVIHGEHRELDPGKVYLLPPNCGLTTWCTGNPEQLYLHFEVSRIGGNPNYLCNELTPLPIMKTWIDKLRTLLNEGSSSPQIYLLFSALASTAMTMLPAEAVNEYNPDLRISCACSHIRDNLAHEYSLAELSKEAGLSQNTFLRKFREVTGSTPHQYILNLRYAMAARLLEDPDCNINAVCEQIGIKDRFHFSRQFKAIYGLPPAKYRSTHLPPDHERKS